MQVKKNLQSDIIHVLWIPAFTRRIKNGSNSIHSSNPN